MRPMANRERRLDRAAWLFERDLLSLGGDLRAARLAAGLTLEEVARQIGTSPADVYRRGRARTARLRQRILARHAAAVGLRVRIRAYPEGAPLRDAGQIELARRFRLRVPAVVPIAFEVPVSSEPGDLRAWDARLTLPGCRCAVEFASSEPPTPTAERWRLRTTSSRRTFRSARARSWPLAPPGATPARTGSRSSSASGAI